MNLGPDDQQTLETLKRRWTTVDCGSFLHLIIHDFACPTGLQPEHTDLLIRLPRGYPDVAPDMFWVDPSVSRSDGSAPAATSTIQNFHDRAWQRWSRHIRRQWRPGRDNLATYLAYVRRAMANEGERSAA